MRIESAEYRSGALQLACSPADGLKFTYNFKPGEYEIQPKKKRRSLDANAYSWVLIDKIAQKLGMSPEDVYRNAVANTGGVTESLICIAEEAADAFTSAWVAGHLGRQVRRFPSNRRGYVNLAAVYGSSDYDTSQMARFINGLVQDAQALGIETKDPGYIDSLLNSWEVKKR